MISRIRIRIFLPILILILLFPVLSWLIFSSTSGWYMERLSRQSLEQLMDSIYGAADGLFSDTGTLPLTRDEERDRSKELLGQVKTTVREDRLQAQLMALNTRQKLTYPGTGDERMETQAIYQSCLELINSGELSGNTGNAKEITTGGNRYLISLYEVKSSGNIRNQYMFGYIAIPDTKALLSYTGGLLLLISILLLFLSLAAAWFIAGGISRPLQELSRHARELGKGNFSQLDTSFPVSEVEQLRVTINRMSGELLESNRRQTVFFQNASHELRTPLMSIGGYAQGIQCDVFPNHQEAAGIILSETARMTDLVDGILTLSKMDSNHMALEIRELDPEEFIRDELASLKGIEIREQISFEVISAGQPSIAAADPALLSRAFRNVISNCARYASEKVEIRLTDETGWTVITISDDGPGFGSQELPHIFERFYKGPGGNFGIGLSIAQKAMEYMGGRAEACSKKPPRHGAVFSLYLPQK